MYSVNSYQDIKSPDELEKENAELQDENKRLKKIEEDYYDFLQKKNEEDWKGDNVVGCLNLRIEQKDKQLTKAIHYIKELARAVEHSYSVLSWQRPPIKAEAERFIREVEK